MGRTAFFGIAVAASAWALACGGGDPESGVVVDVAGFQRGADALLARASEARDAALAFDPDRDLAALRMPVQEGVRLDEALADARTFPAADEWRPDETCNGCLGVEFDPGESISLAPRRGSAPGAVSVTDGRFAVEQQRHDYLVMRGEYAVPVAEIGAIEIRARHARGTTLKIGWSRKPVGDDWLPKKASDLDDFMGVITIDTLPDGEWHVYRVNARTVMRRKLHLGDSIRSLVVVPSNVEGDRVEIDWLRMIPKRESYAHAPFGLAYEMLGVELRSVLFVQSTRRLEWTVDVPREAPELRTGLGLLESAGPVRFRVTVSAAASAAPVEILSREMTQADHWDDVRLDLSRWAGQRVQLALEADSSDTRVAFFSSPRVASRPTRRLNVILLLEDTLRADRLSLYGHTRPTSPERDAWARSGVVFDAAFSQATKTRPSCPSLMTSLYPTATGVWFFNEALAERYVTLAEVMRAKGFETAAFVQNGNGGPVAGLHQGYDQLFDANSVPDSPQIFGEPVLDWIADRGERNFFLYLHARDPHGVYDPPEPFDRWYREDGPGNSPVEREREHDPSWVEQPTAEGRRLLYDGEILHNDFWFGKFLASLDELGVRDDTLIVTLADHGEHLGEDDRWGHRPPSQRHVVHVPLVMVHPSLPATRVTQPVELVDVMPTILDIAGIETPGLPRHGDSLLPLIRAADPSARPGQIGAAFRDQLAVTEEVTSFSERRDSEQVSGSVFFRQLHALDSRKLDGGRVYDYLADPLEEMPVGGAHSAELLAGATDLLRQLKRTNLATWRAMAGQTPPVVETDPDVREQLRSLGYVE